MYITVDVGITTLTWTNPSIIYNGTALSSTQLNAVASVPGSFTYTPAIGTVLQVGTHTLHVDFTPTDSENNEPMSRDVSITVMGIQEHYSAASETEMLEAVNKGRLSEPYFFKNRISEAGVYTGVKELLLRHVKSVYPKHCNIYLYV